MAERYKSIVVLEDGIAHAGIASTVAELLNSSGIAKPLDSIGVPLEFIEHSKRAEILSDLGITSQQIAREIVEWSSTTSLPMQFQQHENADRTQHR
jgi:1-deoxy-D-xylulose-5-phosphate synthase